MKDLKSKKKLFDSYARYSTIAVQMLVIILVGVFGGIELDKLIKLEFPVFTVVLSILSVILAIYYVTKDLIKKK
ncbi:MAG: AtpZ/AtpI family protein [Bacteroidetes bacterium]|nr:AtpZ/AtpI family protein [Bacteroidota bacterium]MCK4288084.1 AtpZ/AtpI family protein [Bacteroidales bacterium]MCK4406106.1 AtpZ/AtpI family protein [Bacteroidales bacterium]